MQSSPSRILSLAFALIAPLPFVLTAQTETQNSISYVGAAWGPDGDAVYCLKQVRGSRAHGGGIWFCKMKWDGSEKEEIAELWPGQGTYIDTQGGPVWMEVNAVTSNVTFGVEYGTDIGMWVMGPDGKNLHRPFEPVWNDKEKQVLIHPSWSPDGSKLVFEEHSQGIMRLGAYDLVKKERRQLTDGPRDRQPVWSPKGDWIAFTHYTRFESRHADRYVWLIRPDGSEQKPVVDEKNKRVGGWWPSWSPDASHVGSTHGCSLDLIDVESHQIEFIDPSPILGECLPYTFMGQHWNKRGWLLAAGTNIRFIDSKTLKGRLLAGGGVYPSPRQSDPSSYYPAHWGLSPMDLNGK